MLHYFVMESLYTIPTASRSHSQEPNIRTIVMRCVRLLNTLSVERWQRIHGRMLADYNWMRITYTLQGCKACRASTIFNTRTKRSVCSNAWMPQTSVSRELRVELLRLVIRWEIYSTICYSGKTSRKPNNPRDRSSTPKAKDHEDGKCLGSCEVRRGSNLNIFFGTALYFIRVFYNHF